MIEDTAVLIDAGYLKELSKHFGNEKYLKLDIIKFSKYLAIKRGFWMKEIYYYTDKIRHSKFSMSNEILNACKDKVLLTKEHFMKNLREEV